MGLFRRGTRLEITNHPLPVGVPFDITTDVPKKKKESTSLATFPTTKMRAVRSPLQSFHYTTVDQGGWIKPEYDLVEPYRIIDTESFANQAVKKKVALAFKHGYEFTSKNKKALRYLRLRLSQIAFVSKLPTELMVRKLFRDLVTCHNAFLVKVRDEKASGGRKRKILGGKDVKPVAAYFPAHPSTMQPQVKDDKIIQWRQVLPDGRYRLFAAEDVIHFTVDKKQGFYYGTPLTVSVADDIRALRKLEENIEMMLYQYLFPLFHYQVGTDEAPAGTTEDGQDEIEVVQSQLQEMTAEGGIVTPHRHKIELLGIKGKQMTAEGYLKHFLNRVLGGLGVSSIDVGIADTTNRNTGESLSRALIDGVKDIQLVLKHGVQEEIVSELLLESTFTDLNTLLDEENQVKLSWREIDHDYLVKMENHWLDTFLKNGISISELRQKLGMDPLRPEDGDPIWDEMYWNLIEKPKALIQAVDEPWSPAALELARSKGSAVNEPDLEKSKQEMMKREQALKKVSSPSGGTKKTSSSPKTNISRKVKPKNQHGSSVPTRKRDELDVYDSVPHQYSKLPQTYTYGPSSVPSLEAHGSTVHPRKKYGTDNIISDAYKQMSLEVIDFYRTLKRAPVQRDIDHVFQLLEAGRESMANTLKFHTHRAYRDGAQKEDIRAKTIPLHAFRHMDNRIETYTKRLRDSLFHGIKRAHVDKKVRDGKITLELAVKDRFDSLEYRTDFLAHVEPNRAFAQGRVITWLIQQGLQPGTVVAGKNRQLKMHDISKDRIPLITFVAQDGACETCNMHEESFIVTDVNSAYYNPDILPPFHPGCQCDIQLEVFHNEPEEDLADGAKTESCVKQVKVSLAKKHPTWSEKKVESAAWAICKTTTGGK